MVVESSNLEPNSKPCETEKVTSAVNQVTARIKSFVGNSGLFVSLLFWIGFGAVVFQKLEEPHELQVKTALRQLWLESRSNFSQIVFDMSQKQPDALDFNSTFSSALASYDKVMVQVTSQEISLEVRETEIKTTWNYVRSAIFSCTVMTTIGYGDLTPHTTWGRAFCMWYALMGIPITLLVLSSVGKWIAAGVSFLYKRISQRLRSHFSTQLISPTSVLRKIDVVYFEKSAKLFLATCILFCYIAVGGWLFAVWEGWTFFEAFYFCFITMTTIGFGDLVPENTSHKILGTLYIFIGLALTSTVIELSSSRYAYAWEKAHEHSSPDMLDEKKEGTEELKRTEVNKCPELSETYVVKTRNFSTQTSTTDNTLYSFVKTETSTNK